MFSKQRRIVVNNRYTQTASMRNGGVMIRLTLKKLIIVGVILLVLLVWAFFVGVLVGQGISTDNANDASGTGNGTIVGSQASDNEVAVTTPDMTQAPQVAETPPPAPTKPQAQTQAATPAPGATTADASTSSRTNDAVISPQELSALSELKGKPAPPDATKVNDEGRQAAATSQSKQPQAKQPQAQQIQTRNTQNSSAAANTGRPEDPAPKATTPPGPGIFDYQYQVAATTDLEGAKRLVSQLRADGLRASMVQGSKEGSKLYRVHVDFRGTPSDTNQLREKLSKFGINRVLLKTKVATQ